MLSQNGLSLDQAPPISVVFRFFFVGSLFGVLCGIFVLFFQSAIFNAHSIEAIILTHTLTLGVMLSFMFAALFQMLPVIAGVKLTSPVLKANLLLYPFILGIITLLFAFYLTNASWLFLLASVLLGTSLLGIVIIMVKNLFSLENHTASSKGITYTLLSLGLVVLFALYLTSALAGLVEGSNYSQIKEAHYSFGLYGWIALLIISISFQVIEMFYVTPSYPKIVTKFMPLSLFSLLLISSIVGIFYPDIWILANILIALLLGSYALLTLKRFTQRKRPITDGTVWFWRLGLSSLLVSMLSLLLTLFMNNDSIKALSYIAFTSFGLSIVFAMFYKIVPFLTWFHLNSQGYIAAPMMHQIIHPKTVMKHLYIHTATIVSFILSIFIPQLIFLAGLLTILSFGWSGYQVANAHLLYRKTQKTGKKVNMGMNYT